MAKGQPPAFRFLTRNEPEGPLVEIGQAWRTAKTDVFSISLDPEGVGSPMRFIMVPNTPKPKAKPAAGEKPAA
jgi:hypothetical protein